MVLVIRPRRDADLDACVAILSTTFPDGYPMRWPADPAAWLTPRGSLAAWVAERDGVPVGHIALRRAAGMDGERWWTAASGLPAERICAVTRLFVAPTARGLGAGAELLSTAAVHAAVLGCRPALDVLDTDRTAIALYDRAGWILVASVPFERAPGDRRLTRYYLGPAPPGPVVPPEP